MKIAKSQTKPSSKECVMKFFKVHSTAKCRIHKPVRLNYFLHRTLLRVRKQAGVDNRSIQFILEIVCFLERKTEVVCFAKDISKA